MSPYFALDYKFKNSKYKQLFLFPHTLFGGGGGCDNTKVQPHVYIIHPPTQKQQTISTAIINYFMQHYLMQLVSEHQCLRFHWKMRQPAADDD